MSLLISCKTDVESEIKNQKVNVQIRRFEKEMMAAKDKPALAKLLAENPAYTASLYRTSPDDTALVSHIFYLLHHPETQKLYQQTEYTFGDLTEIKKEFEQAFKHIKYYYPAFKEPKIFTTFTGLENDFYVSDSLIIIALEPFVGSKALYRPDQPDYILSRYRKEYIVPNIIRFLSNSYNKVSYGDQTFLADMLFFGKSLEFTKTMMPATADSLIMGYTATQMTDTWNAQDLVWAHIIDKNLLYEKNVKLKEKYFGERPFVPEIGPKCPGRIGQWLGWRIIQRYKIENPKVTFQELMANDNVRQLFEGSKYRGQIDED